MEGEGCCGWEPPPDSILVIPPPPLPAFLQLQPPAPNVTSDPCLTAPPDLCTAPPGRRGLEFVELPRHVVSGIDDTWLLVLISCSIGVLLLGSLLALLLLKCREERGSKGEMDGEGETSKNGVVGTRCEAVLYPRLDASSRVLWATLTPRGTTTHRFCCPNNNNNSSSNNNYGRVDPFYLEPEPVYAEPDQYLMKVRPRVSSPTRIENPNLPPLNLHRHTLSRRYPYQHPPLL